MNPQEPPAEDTTLRGQIEAVQVRLGRFEVALEENTKATKEIQIGTADLVAMGISFKEAFKVVSWIGAIAKPLGYIVTLVAAIGATWVSIKEGWMR